MAPALGARPHRGATELGGELVDLVGLGGGAVAVVDVDHRDAGGAGVQHGEQCGHPAEGGAVTHAGGHRDDRPVHQAAQHARQGAVHAGDRDDRVGLVEPVEVRHQAVQAGHPAVEQPFNDVAHHLRGHRRLLGHREIGGARAHHYDEPYPVPRGGLHHDQARGLVHATRQPARDQGRGHRRLRAGGQHVVVVLGQALHDGHHLLRGLARAVDGLGHAVAQRAVQVDAGEAQVLVGQRAQPGERLLGGERAGRDLLQEGPYFFPIHRRASLALPLRKPCKSSVT
jgi:hypothetical protein